MSEIYNYCHIVGKTDVGRKRAANEDNMANAVTQNGLVSLVCDGMGGHVGGATASRIAVTTIIENLNAVYYDDPRIAIGESIDRANEAILRAAAEKPELSGMGSTCVMLLVRDGKVYIGHVGDSRIYLVRSKRIIQLTKDHSYVQMLVDCGQITKEQAEHHPRKNEITNALGIKGMTPATVADDAILPEAGDCFVLCSDGLSGMVSDNSICKVISRQLDMNAQERVDRLVEMANENGGLDNITVQLVEFSVSPNAAAAAEEKKFPVWAKALCAAALVASLGVGGYFLLRNPSKQEAEDGPAVQETAVCDTSLYNYPETIKFVKKGKIVELEFNESSLVLKRDGKQIYEFNSAYDQNSLNVETKGIDVQYNNSLLTFTDKYPGDQVIFYITRTDGTETYKCMFDVSKTGQPAQPKLSIPEDIIKGTGNPPAVKNGDDDKSDEAKADTVVVELVFKQIDKGSKLLFNYSAKPKVIFGDDEKPVGSEVLGEIADDITYDSGSWKMEGKKGQVVFTFKGQGSDAWSRILIPCLEKKSKKNIVVDIRLNPQPQEPQEPLEPQEPQEQPQPTPGPETDPKLDEETAPAPGPIGDPGEGGLKQV